MSNVFFTADTHFSHKAMTERAWRPQYTTVADMNDDLIARWNATVGPKDVVWHLGDWGLGGFAQHLPIVSMLHGTIHLITGNHDKCWPALRDSHTWQKAYLDAGFASVQAYARRRVLGQSVMLHHFPYTGGGDHTDEDRFEKYRLPDDGDWLLHGHVHGAFRQRQRQINVGVDVRDFRPVALDTVETIMQRGTVNE